MNVIFGMSWTVKVYDNVYRGNVKTTGCPILELNLELGREGLADWLYLWQPGHGDRRF